MSEYKVFDDSGLNALFDQIKANRDTAAGNSAAISDLGEDLAGLSQEVVAALEKKQDTLTFDSTPTEGSENPVTSDGIAKYVDEKAVQSDLSINDPENPAYVKNRTHWISAGTNETLLHEQSVEFTYQSYWNDIYGEVNIIGSLEEGTKCKIVFDGVEYIGEVVPITDTSENLYFGNPIYMDVLWGNEGAMAIDDGIHPFIICPHQETDGVTRVGIGAATEGTHTISIIKDPDIYHTLDYKFMPDGYPRSEIMETTLVDNISVTIEDGAPVQNPFTVNLVLGESYKVTFDGTVYDCVAYELDGAFVIGNASVAGMGDDTGEPFIYACMADYSMSMLFASTAGTHTITIFGRQETIIPIDEKFLPEIPDTYSKTEIDAALAMKDIIVPATSTDGKVYTATIEGMDSLVVGAEFTIVPDTNSTVVNPTLNVNGLGAKMLRCSVSTNNATTAAATNANWLYATKPVKVRWNGTFWVTDIVRVDASTLFNNVPVEKGGTGAADAATARTNLGFTEEEWTFTLEDDSTVTKKVVIVS